MPEFVLNRKYNLNGGGHNIQFLKGVPVSVPYELVKAALAIGAECLDGPMDVLDPEEAEVTPLTEAEQEVLVFKAFDTLLARNGREDFGGDGKPTVAAVKQEVNFSLTKKQVNTLYQKYREQKAAEADA